MERTPRLRNCAAPRILSSVVVVCLRYCCCLFCVVILSAAKDPESLASPQPSGPFQQPVPPSLLLFVLPSGEELASTPALFALLLLSLSSFAKRRTCCSPQPVKASTHLKNKRHGFSRYRSKERAPIKTGALHLALIKSHKVNNSFACNSLALTAFASTTKAASLPTDPGSNPGPRRENRSPAVLAVEPIVSH